MKHSANKLALSLSLALLSGLLTIPAEARASSKNEVAALLTQRCDLSRSLRIAQSAFFFDTNIEESQKILNCIVAADPGVTAESSDFNQYRLVVQIAKALATGKADTVVEVVDQSLKFSFE